MPSSSSSYTSSDSYMSSSSDGSSSHRRSRRSSQASHDSDWTVSYAKLNKRQPMGIRFMGYAAGRPPRATAVVKKVRDAPDNRSVLSVSTAGSIFAYEPETRMYWVREHGSGGGATASFTMHGAMHEEMREEMHGAMPGPFNPPPPPMARPAPPPVAVGLGQRPPPMARPPPIVPTVRVAGPPRNSPPAPTIPGFNMPVSIDTRRMPFMR